MHTHDICLILKIGNILLLNKCSLLVDRIFQNIMPGGGKIITGAIDGESWEL
jgi:hypothetical protein